MAASGMKGQERKFEQTGCEKSSMAHNGTAHPGHATRRGVCLVISAPSGAGKSTIANALRASDTKLKHSVSVTTRQPRPGEKEGVHYYFRTMEQFEAMAQAGELL